MASIKIGTTEASDQSSKAVNDVDPRIPTWITEDYFVDILVDAEPAFKRIKHFEVRVTAGDGENYASTILRINIHAELHYGALKEFSFMLKAMPTDEQAHAMISDMSSFQKELAMYTKYIPEFEQMFLEVGKRITFGPKHYRFKKDPGVEYILLEDLSPKDYKNENRLEGLNIEQTESVLRLLASLHAASAVWHANNGEYDPIIKRPMMSEEQIKMMEPFGKQMVNIFVECMKTHKFGLKYAKKLSTLNENTFDNLIKISKIDPNDFNVVLHGDLWINNIMFRKNDEGKCEDTIFVDFQISRYGSPVIDLFYFLLSSTNYDIKLSQFDYFIMYYFNHLAENLRLLRYQKQFPTLKQLRVDLLNKSFFVLNTLIGIIGIVLLEPSKDATMTNLLGVGADGKAMKVLMYSNPRFVKHIEAILPWMEMMGYLD